MNGTWDDHEGNMNKYNLISLRSLFSSCASNQLQPSAQSLWNAVHAAFPLNKIMIIINRSNSNIYFLWVRVCSVIKTEGKHVFHAICSFTLAHCGTSLPCNLFSTCFTYLDIFPVFRLALHHSIVLLLYYVS